MGKSVITIPATISKFTASPLTSTVKRRVAAYARVSTDHEDQQNSYEAQVDYYAQYIQGRSDWEYVGIYADEGITGCNTKKRDGFNRMIEDALNGRIDLIVTKSVSRFARNTVDTLTTIRKLRESGIECFFEKENIWTFDNKGELLITIMGSLAQEESRSISENCTWGQRKRFADGKVTVPFKRFLGYDRGPDGNLVVNPEQAVLVKRIYAMFLQGKTPHGIARELTQEGILTPGGCKTWTAAVIRSILSNEKYKGDALLQKTFCVDFLTKKFKRNDGEVPQYYVEHNHEAIIEPEVFEMVQRELARRSSGTNRHSGVHSFSGKIQCGQCGGWYGSKVWHSNDAYRRTIWQCNQKYKNAIRCSTPSLDEATIRERFVVATNQLLAGRETAINVCKQAIATVFDVSELEREEQQLLGEMRIVSEMLEAAIRENATVALDQIEYQKRYDALTARFDELQGRHNEIVKQISDRKNRRGVMEDFLKALRKQGGEVTEFDENLWCSLLDFVTVYSKDDIRFTFRNGMTFQG